jgi:hypothetical protein
MVPWRIYQQIAAELDVSPETMHLVNVLADGGYLTENQPPYLNLITNSITSSNGETDSGRSFPTQPSDDSFSLE